jgi:hypothetical protein
MIEQCYKQIAEELGVNEYKVLADMLRIFFTSKQKLKKLFTSKKINEKVYEYLLDNFPVISVSNAPRVFSDPIKGLPHSFVIFDKSQMRMDWPLESKSIDIQNDLADRSNYVVVHQYVHDIKPTETYFYKNNKLDTVRIEWYKYKINPKLGPYRTDEDDEKFVEYWGSFDDEHSIITTFKKTGAQRKEWYKRNPKLGPYRTIEDDEKFVEYWHRYFNDEPSTITTFKKTGAQRKEWLVKRNSTQFVRFRKNGLPSIIDEDGTQIWTTVPGGLYQEVNGVMVTHDEVGNGEQDKDVEDGDYYAHDFAEIVHDTYYNKYGDDEDIYIYINRRDKTKPTIIKADGTRIWYKDGYKHHVIYPNGKSEWWDKGQKSKTQQLLKTKLKNNEVVDNIMKYL